MGFGLEAREVSSKIEMEQVHVADTLGEENLLIITQGDGDIMVADMATTEVSHFRTGNIEETGLRRHLVPLAVALQIRIRQLVLSRSTMIFRINRCPS
jgi:hypothetical protein